MFVVRPALPLDANPVSELVLLSDCGLLAALFGPRAAVLIRWLLPRQGNPYSHSNALVITERSGGEAASAPVLGAMVGALVSTTHAASLRTAAQLARWYGPAVISRLPRLARAGSAVDRLAPDDFYLSHIAVFPAHQGRGAGAALLRASEDHARSLGARRLVLDVEEDNHGAHAFYARMGYAQDSGIRIHLGRHGTFSFHRLARGL